MREIVVCIPRATQLTTRRFGQGVANALAPMVPVTTKTTTYPLEQANEALDDLRHGRFTGSGVLIP